MKLTTKVAFFLLLAVVIGLAGCGKKDKHVVAKVGDREISIEDVEGVIGLAGFQFSSADMELKAKQDILDTLIDQNLLIIGAYEKGLDSHEDVHRAVDGEKDKFLLDVLFEEKIVSKAEPSEAEIKDWYARMGDEVKASHILVDSLATAQEVLAKLKEGAAFEELAVQYSTDPSAKRNQGDLGWFTWGTMVDSFQDAAFKMQPGDVSAPVKSDFGYHIIKVVDRRKVERLPGYEESKPQIRSMIVERRKRTLMQNYAEELRKKYAVTVEKATCDFVLKKLEFLYPPMIGNRPRWRNNIDPAQLDRDEHALVLGRYPGGQLTLGEYLTGLQRIAEARRPDFDKYDSLAEVIFQMSFLDILVLEAKANGLDKNEKYERKVKLFQEMAMADVLASDSIPKDVEVTEDEIQQYYNEHPDEFTSPLRFHVIEIQIPDSAKAEKYRSSIRSEVEFKRIAAAETQRPGMARVSGDLGVIFAEQYPELFEAAKSVKAGRIGGPVRNLGRYSIVWIKERMEPELQTLENSRSRIMDRVAQGKKEVLYRAWIAEMRKRVPIDIDRKLLEESVDHTKYQKTDSVQAG